MVPDSVPDVAVPIRMVLGLPKSMTTPPVVVGGPWWMWCALSVPSMLRICRLKVAEPVLPAPVPLSSVRVPMPVASGSPFGTPAALTSLMPLATMLKLTEFARTPCAARAKQPSKAPAVRYRLVVIGSSRASTCRLPSNPRPHRLTRCGLRLRILQRLQGGRQSAGLRRKHPPGEPVEADAHLPGEPAAGLGDDLVAVPERDRPREHVGHRLRQGGAPGAGAQGAAVALDEVVDHHRVGDVPQPAEETRRVVDRQKGRERHDRPEPRLAQSAGGGDAPLDRTGGGGQVGQPVAVALDADVEPQVADACEPRVQIQVVGDVVRVRLNDEEIWGP